jgi:signal transduction histidine kinase
VAAARAAAIDLGLADPPEGEPVVVPASRLLREALANLLHNALRYSRRAAT